MSSLPSAHGHHGLAFATNPDCPGHAPRDRLSWRRQGVWAPGVRLLSSIGFRTKAVLIALTFLLPLAVLAWNYFTSQSAQIAFSAKERVGIVYARQVMPLMALLHAQRAAALSGARAGGEPPGWQALHARVQAQLGHLAQAERDHGAELGTAKAYAAFLTAGRALRTAGPARDALQQAYGAQLQALIDLLGAATDGSNLTLDPDIDTYYLMDTTMFRLPVMVDAAGRIGLDAGLAGAQGSQDLQAAAARRAIEQLTLLTSHQAAIAVGLDKAQAYNPEVGRAVQGTGMQRAVQALAASADQALLHPAAGHNATAALADEAVAAMVALSSSGMDALDTLIAARVAGLQGAARLTFTVLAIGLAMSLYVFMAFHKVLDGGLREVAFHIEAMRGGDLTTHPQARGSDEAAHLMRTLAEMQQSLRGLVGQVRSTSDRLVGTSAEIADGADDLNERTEQSSAHLQQTASAMEQISATVRRNEASLSSAARLADDNAAAAEQGGLIIGEVVRTMQGINASSRRIGDIIGTIDGIAFQTNILALNAAVEAARAGDQGRGFAVVASEVRALAQRAAAAAREIKGLVGGSVEQVDCGVTVVQRAGQAIGEVVDTAQKVRALLAEVAAGAREQSTGVAQSASAVQEIDHATQQNAALVEQTASAAGELRAQAQALAAGVAKFKVPAAG